MAGVYAAARLRGRWTRYERAAIVLPLMIAALAAPIQFLAGDWAARTISRDEPTKLAAIEGLSKTTKGAPLHVLGLYEHGQVRYGVRIPKALSLLAFHDPSARVQGLDAVPPWNRPPVNVVRVSFQTMVGIGTVLAILGILTVVVRVRRRRLPTQRAYYAAAGPLSVVALVAGWVTTEVGRQPWIVYGYMRTSEAVSSAPGLRFGLYVLLMVYTLMTVATVYVLRRLARRPLPVAPQEHDVVEEKVT
jgi:cytochrome d ubiquinol oxidase subunit I